MPDKRPWNRSVFDRPPNSPQQVSIPSKPSSQPTVRQEQRSLIGLVVTIASVLALILAAAGVIVFASHSPSTSSATSQPTTTLNSTPAPSTFPCANPVSELTWSPNNPYLAIGCAHSTSESSVDVWNVETKQKLFTVPGDNIASVAWSPDGTKLAASYYVSKNTAILSSTGQTLLTVQGTDTTSEVSWSPDGKYIFMNGNYPVIADSNTGSIVQKVWDTPGWSSGGSNMVWLSNDTIVGIGNGNDSVVEWNRQTEQLTELYKENYYPSDYMNAVALSPDGTKIVLGLENGNIRIIDSASGAVLANQKTSADGVRAVAWSPDGRLIASGGYPTSPTGIVQISDAQTGKQISTSTIQGTNNSMDKIFAITWSSDNKAIAVACGNVAQIVPLT